MTPKHFLSGNASFLSLSSPAMTSSPAAQTGAFSSPVGYFPHVVKFAVNIEEQDETFFVQDIPGRGKGIVAARSVKRGEFLFSEPPLFTLPPSPTNSNILGALAKCTREEQRQYFALANSYRKQLLPALAIWETNFLLLGNGNNAKTLPQQPAQDLAGIFLLASRFNSSCIPNVSKAWDELRNVMVFRTLRDIAEGEELCFNYCDVLETQQERKRVLSSEFGFECACPACCLQGEEAVESDRRRISILRLFDEVGRCGNEPTLGIRKVCIMNLLLLCSHTKCNLVKIKLALRMLKEESLIHYEASFCYDAFQFCVLVSALAPPHFPADADVRHPGIRLYQRKGVDTEGLGGLVHNVRPRQ